MAEFIIIICYLAVTAFISFLALKYSKTAKDYLVAQGQFGIGLIVVMLFAEVTAGAGTIGAAQMGMDIGFSAVWAKWGMAAGYVLSTFVVGRFYYVINRQFGVMSVPGAFSILFDDRTKLAMILMTVISYIIIFSVQPKAVAVMIAPLIGVSVEPVAWVIGGLFILIAVLGGMKGIAWMNTVHCVIMYVGISIVAIVACVKAGGPSVVYSELPVESFSLFQPSWQTALAWALSSMLSIFTSSIGAAIVFGGKSMRDVKVGVAVSSFLMIPFAVFVVFIGMVANILTPEADSSGALFSVAANLGPAFSIIVNLAIVAAIVSSAPAFLLFCAASLTRDFYLPVISPGASEKIQLRFSRLMIVILGILAIWLGNSASSILGSILGALQIRSVASVLLVLALVFPRIDARAGFWTVAIGGIAAVFWYAAKSPFGIEPLWAASAVSTPVLVIFTFLAKQPRSEGWLRYKKASKL